MVVGGVGDVVDIVEVGFMVVDGVGDVVDFVL